MFFRVGKIKCEEGKADEVINYFKNNEDFFNDTDGIHSLSYFESANDEVIGVAVWESKESLDSNAERAQSVMEGLMKYVISPPEISKGLLEHQFNNN